MEHNVVSGQDRKNLRELRKNIFLTAYSYAGNIAHLASSFSVVEIVYVLYMKGIMRYKPDEPLWKERDILILGKGHASLALYAIFAMTGIIKKDELWTFCKEGTRLGGEGNMRLLPGAEASTGSLGHGLSFAAGIALADKMDGRDSRIFVILGDGECEEGAIWEAVMSAVRFKLDNLTVILDNNRLQKMGYVKDTMAIDSWAHRWESFGWQIACCDGHDIDAIGNTLKKSQPPEKPRLVIAETVKGKGVSIMENNPDWHFKMPNKKELKIFMEELDVSGEELINCRKPTF
jgi:transketolase